MFPHCPHCRAPSPAFEQGKRIACTACGFTYYHNTAAAVIALLHRDGRVLLTRRARDPGRGLFDTPGGFVDPGESAEDALRREIREELGLELTGKPEWLGSAPNTYPYKGITYTTCDLVFAAPMPAGEPRLCPDEIAEAVWSDPRTADRSTFAFASVGAALDLFLAR